MRRVTFSGGNPDGGPMKAGRCPYRQLTPEDRARALDAAPDLLDAARDARLEGWHRWELPEIGPQRGEVTGRCWLIGATGSTS